MPDREIITEQYPDNVIPLAPYRYMANVKQGVSDVLSDSPVAQDGPEDLDDHKAMAPLADVKLFATYSRRFHDLFNRWKLGFSHADGTNYVRSVRSLIAYHIGCLKTGISFEEINGDVESFVRLIDEYEQLTAVCKHTGKPIVGLGQVFFYMRNKMRAKVLLDMLRSGEGNGSNFTEYKALLRRVREMPNSDSLEALVRSSVSSRSRAVLMDGAFNVTDDEIMTFEDQAVFNDLKVYAKEFEVGGSNNFYLFLANLKKLYPFVFSASFGVENRDVDENAFNKIMSRIGSNLSLSRFKSLAREKTLVDKGIFRFVNNFYFGDDSSESVARTSIADWLGDEYLGAFEVLVADIRKNESQIKALVDEVLGGDLKNARTLIAKLQGLQTNPRFQFSIPPLGRFGLTVDDYEQFKKKAGLTN